MGRAILALAMAMLLLAPFVALADVEPEEASDDSLVELYLGRMSCPTGACTYVGAIIDMYPQERGALLDMDWRALPALSQVLMSGECGLRVNVAEIFVDEILSRRAQGAEGSPEADAAEAGARDAMEAYTGREYVPHQPNPNWE